MIKVNFDNSQFKKITDAMEDLQKNYATNAARRALRKGANVIKNEAVRNAKALDDPNTPERIHENITTQTGGAKRDRKEKGITMRVGVLGGARNLSDYGELAGKGKENKGGDTWYFRFLEFGTSEMPAKPFLRPAMLQKQDQALSILADELEKELTKEVSKRK